MRLFFQVLMLSLVCAHLAFAVETQTALDVMLVLDNSASMRQSDPLHLLPKVVSDFTERLGPDDRIGIVTFDQSVHSLLTLTKVSQGDFTALLSQMLKRIDYSGKQTDIPGGLEDARHILENEGRKNNARQILILMTDGKIDVGSQMRNSERKSWLLNKILPAAQNQKLRIFGITLSAGADMELIQSMTVATEGNYYQVDSADKIADTFSDILERLQQPVFPAQPSFQPQSTGSASTLPKAPPVSQVQMNPTSPTFPHEFISTKESPDKVSNPPLTFLTISLIVAVVFSCLLAFYAIVFVKRRLSKRYLAMPAARLVNMANSKDVYMLKERITGIGRRGFDNNIELEDNNVSRRHALIQFQEINGLHVFRLLDINSENGTQVDGEQVPKGETKGLTLKHGNIINIGSYSFRFLIDKEQELEQKAIRNGVNPYTVLWDPSKFDATSNSPKDSLDDSNFQYKSDGEDSLPGKVIDLDKTMRTPEDKADVRGVMDFTRDTSVNLLVNGENVRCKMQTPP